MLRKKNSGLLSLIFMIIMLGCSKSVQETPATDFKYILDPSGTSIIIQSYKGKGGTVIIPSKIKGYPVVELEYECFNKNIGITSLVIPDTVIKLGDYCFYRLQGLTNIKLPKNIKTIPIKAFWSCRNLKNINIPEGVEVIGDNAFSSCGLTKIKIPNSIKIIGSQAFADCINLVDVEIPNKQITYEKELYPTFNKCPLNIASQKRLKATGYPFEFD